MISQNIPAIALGLAAAALTSLSYIPQVKKAFRRGATKDLSVKTFSILFVGLLLWVLYGILEADVVIIVANAVGALLVGFVFLYKVRDLRSGLS